MNWSLVPASLGGWLATAVALILGLLTWWTQTKKGKVDESAMILEKWQSLANQMTAMADLHRSEMKAVREELASERSDNAKLRSRVRELEDQVAGLQRQLIQLGRSTGNILNVGSHPTPSTETGNRTSDDILREMGE